MFVPSAIPEMVILPDAVSVGLSPPIVPEVVVITKVFPVFPPVKGIVAT
jgi:hypothetical protein